MLMSIRTCQYKDKQSVMDLWHVCGLVTPQNDPAKDIERKLLLGADLFLLGFADKNLVGSVMGGYDGHRGWINYLAVDPIYQRQGFARQLMQQVEEKLMSKGCPKINLQIRNTNASVMGFYESIGFATDAVTGMGKRLIVD